MRRPEWLTRDYLTIDSRSLGAGRIGLGLVLLLDLLRRISVLPLWYSNLGLLPNHTVLWRPPFPRAFSLFFMASLPSEAAVGFVLCAVAYLMLLFGNRTRAAHLASLIAVLSLHGRVLFVQNGGDVVLVELCVWTLFLPTGRRFSLDSLRARRAIVPPDDGPVVSLAALAVVVQLAVIYFFNALQKSGPTWRGGGAVHYTLYAEGVVTKLGVWVRGWLTLGQSRLLTWSTLTIESILPLLILTPVGRRPARRLAIALMVGLHLGFASFLNLGIFVPAMLAFTPFLVPAADWDALERWWRRRQTKEGDAARGDGIRLRALQALAFLERRGFLRLDPRPPKPAQWREWLRTWSGPLREWTVALLIVCATARLLVDNPAVTRVNARRQPRIVAATTSYLQMLQAWLLFAPDAPLTDAAVAVDAVTTDGRHVDPLNEALSPEQPWLGTVIPARLGQNAFAAAYMLRIPFHPEYFGALTEWILGYPDRTERPADRIVSFEVTALERDNPPPDQHEPGETRARLLYKYPQ
ncbi:MAG TPA: HTTM domain-containing protein [Polyangia bacterium]|nr:HTTM domain-containing protein [Polyangia bacterium]